MLFNTIDYLMFFPMVFVVYYLLPKKVRYIWLLIVSYYFYMNWNPWYVLLLVGGTVVSYVSARLIERQKTDQCKCKMLRKTILIICLFLLLGILGYFKYYDFVLEQVNGILSCLGGRQIHRKNELLLPVGISFYVLQALGYVIDVYRGEIYAEKNFFKYALFISFFPQLVAGPIERSKNLLIQLAEPKVLNWHSFRKGLLLILYGVFCKIVIADRIAIIVDTVYNAPTTYPGFFILYAAVLFSFQIYCDFYGYSTIARGSAILLGIHLVDNFNAPYYAQSIKEFWRRWHISLSSWFKDYLYIPLGGNRKGRWRKNVNLIFVFGISGLWHGASWNFIVWGLLNGIYQVIGDIWTKAGRVIKARFMSGKQVVNDVRQKNFSGRLFDRVFTFILITITWIFFAAGGFRAAIDLLVHMISINNWTILFDGSLYELGVSRPYTFILILSILLLMVVDYIKYKGKDVAELVLCQNWWFRTVVYISLIFGAMLFGCYGEMYDTQQFIYFQF